MPNYAMPMVFRICLLAALALSGGEARAQWPSSTQQPQEGWASRPYVTQPDAQPGVAPMDDPSLRAGRLEEQLRSMRGEIEQLQRNNRDLQERLQKVQEDYDFRFQQIEGGKKGAAPRRSNTAASSASSIEARPSQLGAPPRNLGQLPADRSGAPVDIPPGSLSQPLEPLPGSQSEGSGGTGRVSAGADNPEDQYDLAYGYMLRGDYDMAEESFRDFLSGNPKHANAAKAEYWLGESQYQRKQYKAAAESFLKVYNEHPDSEKAPESLLRLGMSLKSLGQKDAACATFAEVGNKYPKSSSAVKKRVQTEQKNAGC